MLVMIVLMCDLLILFKLQNFHSEICSLALLCRLKNEVLCFCGRSFPLLTVLRGQMVPNGGADYSGANEIMACENSMSVIGQFEILAC
ncbi:hypothetical protein KC19_5G075900 [Ceratodon purpureus]|uniref:Secreted protein n=1 Tax=Ceratodon purpureus TaxID=3225 RepID=A0A8T0I148_CERPU|nr:hypothetical protein KC19_5G075900 [Ceratodon purpureus]